MRGHRIFTHLTLLLIAAFLAPLAAGLPALAQDAHGSSEDLAKKAQNPVADMISLPFQNNVNMLQGPYGETANVLNVQPVIPFSLGEDWNLVTRTIMPIVSQTRTSRTEGPTFGLGDLNPTFFLSPAKPGEFAWGVGPTFSLPTAGADVLGTGKWEAGPAAVGLFIKGPWVVGALVNNLWSFAGPYDRKSVSAMTAQYFINYNFPGGWYLTSSPIVAANWKGVGGQWTVPLGGGFGRVFRLGELPPMNAQLQAFYNVVRPDYGAQWQIRFQLALLFPTK